MKVVLDHLGECRSVYAAAQAIGSKVGVGPQMLRKWVIQAQLDAQHSPRVATTEQQRIKQLERKNRDLKESDEILSAASFFVARELDLVTVDLFVHRSNACTELRGRIDLLRGHRAVSGSRRAPVSKLEEGRAVGAHDHRRWADRRATDQGGHA